jgi:hypothetical protein
VVAQHNHYLGQDTPHVRVLLPYTAKIKIFVIFNAAKKKKFSK